jgi:hypothetical protein
MIEKSHPPLQTAFRPADVPSLVHWQVCFLIDLLSFDGHVRA